MMDKIKVWFRNRWLRLRKWVITLLIAIGVISAPFVFADDNSLTWTNAVTYEDGTAIEAGDLAGTNIYYAAGVIGDPDITDIAAYSLLTQVNPDVTNYVDTNRGNGLHCYYVTHETTQGIESAPSNVACKTIDIRVPGTPQNLEVN